MPQHFHPPYCAWSVVRVPLVRARVAVTEAMVTIESRAFAGPFPPSASDRNAFE